MDQMWYRVYNMYGISEDIKITYNAVIIWLILDKSNIFNLQIIGTFLNETLNKVGVTFQI